MWSRLLRSTKDYEDWRENYLEGSWPADLPATYPVRVVYSLNDDEAIVDYLFVYPSDFD